MVQSSIKAERDADKEDRELAGSAKARARLRYSPS
jgi:hypothetical protein